MDDTRELEEFRILIVDDNEGQRATLQAILQDEGYEVVATGKGLDAVSLVREERFDIAILDIILDDISGIEVLKRLKALQSDLECVMITAQGTLETATDSINLGARAYFLKPIDLTFLISYTKNLSQGIELRRSLSLSEEKYKTIFESASDGIILWSREDLKILDVNKRLVDLLGFTKDELIGSDLGRLFKEELIPLFVQFSAEDAPTGATTMQEVLALDGRIIPVEVTVSYLTYYREPAALGIVRDISERLRAESVESALRAVNRILASSFELKETLPGILQVLKSLAPVKGISVVISSEGDTMDVVTAVVGDDGLCDLCDLEFPAQEFTCHCTEEMCMFSPSLFTPEVTDILSKWGVNSLWCLQITRENRLASYLLLMSDKKETCSQEEIDSAKMVARELSYSIQNYSLYLLLKKSEERYRDIFENVADCIYISSLDGKFLDINDAGLKMFGYDSREELLGKEIRRDIYAESQARDEFIRDLALHRSVKDKELTYKRRDGSLLYALETCTIITDKIGKTIGYEGIIRDITETKRLRSEIEDRDKRRSAQIDLAGQFLRSITPMDFYKEPLKVTVELAPAQDLSGDFFDVIELDDKQVALVIGDISSKDIGAAVKSISLANNLKNSAHILRDPALLMGEMNRYIYEKGYEPQWFATILYCVFNLTTKELSYVRAGHPYPIWWHHESGKCEELTEGGIICGVFPRVSYTTFTVRAEPGDKFLIYTDGLTENVGSEGRFIMRRDLLQHIETHGNLSVHDIKYSLLRELRTKGEGLPRRDDVLFSVIEITPDPWIHFSYPAVPLEEIKDHLVKKLERLNLKRQTIYEIQLSLTEAMSNALTHGNRGDPKLPILCSYLISGESIEIKVRDFGQGFDPTKLPDPTRDGNAQKPSGRGLYLISHLMTSISFNETGNEIRLLKRF